MSPMSPTLFVLTCLLTAALAVLIVVLWTRHRPGRARPAVAVVGRAGLIVLTLLLTCSAFFLRINQMYGFYTTWGDLLGRSSSAPEPVTAAGLTAASGRVVKRPVRGHAPGVSGQARVWLPPQYFDPAWQHKSFPVVYMLPGQTGPGMNYRHFDFGTQAAQAIAGGVHPFIAVLPPIVIAPPRDTECVNVPNGPQAESWLTKDVSSAVLRAYRADPVGKHWSIIGWSTGGFCSANVVLRNPKVFGSAAALGANYVPYLDHTTGALFGGNAALKQQNTPEWLYRTHKGTRGTSLLLVSGEQDRSSWAQTKAMAKLTKGDPNVTLVTFPIGGHNFRNYRAQLPTVFSWLQRVGALG